jgi:hypothetical protein
MTTAEIRAAAETIVPLAELALARLVERCMEIRDRGESARGASRRPRGRGSQLRPADQLLCMFVAQAMTDNPREVAEFTGYNTRTVRRILSSTKYRKLDEYVSQRAYESFRVHGGIRRFVRRLMKS